jgi:hypothetical protein
LTNRAVQWKTGRLSRASRPGRLKAAVERKATVPIGFQ